MRMKKKITKKVTSPTLVNFILDKSGSMGSVLSATISGFNEYIKTLKNSKEKYNFSLTLFDTVIEQRYTNKPLEDVTELSGGNYIPDGMTALYDAACKTISDIEKIVKKGQKVLTVIMTDGEENSSREYNQTQLKEAVERLQKEGNWTFVFLGANQDAWLNAQKFGFNQRNVSTYNATSGGTQKAFRAVANSTILYAQAADLSTSKFFTEKDQEDLKSTK